MKTRLLHTLFASAVLALAFLTGLTLPAAAQQQTVYVKLPTGQVVPVTVDVPPGSSLNDIQLPGTPVQALRENRGTEVKRRAQALAV